MLFIIVKRYRYFQRQRALKFEERLFIIVEKTRPRGEKVKGVGVVSDKVVEVWGCFLTRNHIWKPKDLVTSKIHPNQTVF